MSTPVEKIKERLSIVEVVSQYVDIKKAGRHYKGRSPFSNEKTPSFFVSPDRGAYYCFSTNQGGDIFTITQLMEGVDFKGALKILAEKAGVELVPEDPKKRTERETLFSALEHATVFFEEACVKQSEVITYLHKRGVSEKTMREWRIGFAPPEWRALKEHLLAKHIGEEMQKRAGLVKSSDGAGSTYDVFRNRVMFPICDNGGRVVAFSGRAVDTDDPNIPKYVNSPETELYKKSEILFGYHKAKHGIRTYDFSLIVEGQFDLVLAHQAGFTNTVAISGTALTAQHLGFLEQLSHNVVLALDSDQAGIASMKRAASLMIPRGMDVKVAIIPDGKDPADLVAEDPKHLKDAVRNAVHIVPFLIDRIRDDARDDRAFRLRVREEVLPLLSVMPNKIDREYFEETVAAALSTTKDAVHYEVERMINEKGSAQEETNQSFSSEAVSEKGADTSRKQNLSEHVFGILLWQEGMSKADIDVARLRTLLTEAVGEDVVHDLAQIAEEVKARRIFEVETEYGDDVEKLKKAIPEMLADLATLHLRACLRKKRQALVEAERSGDSQRAEELLKECSEMQQKLGHIGNSEDFSV